MAKKRSAGILPYRLRDGVLQVFLVHYGGPYWAGKDLGAWSFPKGEVESGDDLFDTARREFKEETGHEPPDGEYVELGTLSNKSVKEVTAWAVETTLEFREISNNTATIEWPPRSGKRIEIPEVDKGSWFDAASARNKLNPYQVPFIDRLLAHAGPVSAGDNVAPGEQAKLL